MLVGSQIELGQSQTNNLACRAREKRRTPRSRCLLVCVVVIIAYMLWCAVDVFFHYVSPYWPDCVLYDQAKDAALQIGVEKLQLTADAVLSENYDCNIVLSSQKWMRVHAMYICGGMAKAVGERIALGRRLIPLSSR